MLITGGAGCIGINAAERFALSGWEITFFDNLSRPKTERNLAWILNTHPGSVRHVNGDGALITIDGDGRQVRDLLDIRDLCDLYAAPLERIEDCMGQVFNIGGGPPNARSVIEVLHQAEDLLQKDAHCTYAGWRAGDQPSYVSDIGMADRVLGWQPRIDVGQGLEVLAS
jgi:nucleoside-diphosphate-sugar epimerase